MIVGKMPARVSVAIAVRAEAMTMRDKTRIVADAYATLARDLMFVCSSYPIRYVYWIVTVAVFKGAIFVVYVVLVLAWGAYLVFGPVAERLNDAYDIFILWRGKHIDRREPNSERE